MPGSGVLNPTLEERHMAVHVPTIRRWSAIASALVLASVTLAACGSGSKSSSTSAASTPTTSSASTTTSPASGTATSALALTPVEHSEDSLAFSKKTLTAKAGTVTIAVANPGSNKYPHGIAIEGNGVDKDGKIAAPGRTSTVTVNLKPGTYTFYCPVKGHEKYGMKGTLTVQ